MSKTINAYTKPGTDYPGFVNLTEQDDGSFTLHVRGDPRVVDGVHVCGYASQKGEPGRCTPGDDHCNNYCNMAPEKGPMAPAPLDAKQVLCGATVAVALTRDEVSKLGFLPG